MARLPPSMVPINETTLGLTFAVLGVVFSVAWLVLGLYGINSLREIKAKLDEREGENEL
jgi:hypothetical protein